MLSDLSMEFFNKIGCTSVVRVGCRDCPTKKAAIGAGVAKGRKIGERSSAFGGGSRVAGTSRSKLLFDLFCLLRENRQSLSASPTKEVNAAA